MCNMPMHAVILFSGKAADEMAGLDKSLIINLGSDLSLLSDETEVAIMRMLASWPRVVETAANGT